MKASSVIKMLRDPAQYIPQAGRVILQQFCGLLQNRSFFLQGQMDIHPNARWRATALKRGGFSPDGESRPISNLDPWDNTRRDMFALLLRSIVAQGVPGEFAELGVYKGLSARLIHHYAPERRLHLFDTFEGFTSRSSVSELNKVGATTTLFADTSVELVRRFIAPCNANVFFHKGFFPESIPHELLGQRFAFVHLDADLYEPIMRGLAFFYPRLSYRGMIVVHDYNSWPGARDAVDEFCADKPEFPVPMPDKNGSALIVKQAAG